MTTAADWFSDEYEFRQLCGDAQSLARSEAAQDFAAEMTVKAKTYGLGCFITISQLEWLCKIADWEVPRRKPIKGENWR